MAQVRAGSLAIEYEVFGRPEHPVILLVADLGSQLISWRTEFCELLAGHGYRVIRFDNRDSGLTATLVPLGTAYRLADLADDAVALLDALRIPAAHLVGVSMGGMIVQQLAIDHPTRVRSLCSLLSHPGDRVNGEPRPDVAAAFVARPASTREQVIGNGVHFHQLVGSPDHPADPEELIDRVGESYDRAYRPDGSLRQLFAVRSSPDRTEGLRRVGVPTLVVHGDADPLIEPSGGKATAAAVPDAELWLIPGVGHELPRALWPELAARIARNAERSRKFPVTDGFTRTAD
ncbi:alpha/beta fold hydrolase [Kitasatospora sp. NBC_01287]|uniref:alpha/beta fold hydrolase n=1 Tax=Kitasatospora sp. NBC_01287 TaxID=2903573 RepID=UPI00224CA416|nr:alpha/beta hydrolase [Kitasatospora sp. NBC_01287]MCX4751397.1 alpha/beta fold hydrolase [Kitasatospora sp. NBC_01287]